MLTDPARVAPAASHPAVGSEENVVADNPHPSGANPQPSLWHGITWTHAVVFLGCWFGGIFDGMDANLFSVMLPNALGELAHTADKAVISQLGSWVTCLFLIGWTVGGIVFGAIGDRFGRVRAMIFSILLYSVFTGAAGLAQDPVQLAVCRFLTGLGIGGEMVSIATLLSEVWPERTRALAVGALITSYQVGVLLSGLVSQWVDGWRAVFLVGALPALLTILIRLNLEEPERWRLEKAGQTARQETASPLREIFQSRWRRDVLIGGMIFACLLIGYWASLVWIPAWIHALPGLSPNGQEKSIATAYHGLAATVGCLLAGLLADRLGRRTTTALGFLGSFAASALLFLTNDRFSSLIYWQDALLGLFMGLCQAILYIYLPELFSTRVRATAVGFCLNVGRLSAAVAALFVGPLVGLLGGYGEAAMAFSLAYLAGAATILGARETKGQPLPD